MRYQTDSGQKSEEMPARTWFQVYREAVSCLKGSGVAEAELDAWYLLEPTFFCIGKRDCLWRKPGR